MHLIIDAYQDHFADAGWRAVAGAGLSGVSRFLSGRSQLLLPRLVTERFVADAAFVDGSHVFHNVSVDLYFLEELVRPSGLVVLDDCQWPSVATAVRYFELNVGWRPVTMPASTRLSACRMPNQRIDPRFEDFQPFG
ncbi:MAG: class I SAM-dependent methyltransferase [Actinobacteria bacterium]|nr:class I SAM-dependent methyltransferase [Actinomycetota bacterium]